MKHLWRSPSSLSAFACLGLVLLNAGAAGPQPPSNKQLREIQMFALQQDGSLTEISREIAAIDNEQFGMSAIPTSKNTVAVTQNSISIARLSGGTANIRYTTGQNIRIIAQLPDSVEPGQIELELFERRGKTRITQLRPFARGPSHWNTLSFHARRLKDGRWLFEPQSQLDSGEYCFSPRFNNDNFCFGIDKT